MLLLTTHKGWINILKEIIFRIDLVLDIDKSVISECSPVTFLQVEVDGVSRISWRTTSTVRDLVNDLHLLGSPGFTDLCLGLVCLSSWKLLLELEVDNSLGKHTVNVKVFLPDSTLTSVFYF